MSDDKYVGLDVHQSSIVIAVHDHQGKCVMGSIIETKHELIANKGTQPFISFERKSEGPLLIRDDD